MEMKFERKLAEFIVHIDKLLNTRMHDAEREETENLPINDEFLTACALYTKLFISGLICLFIKMQF